MKQVIYSIVALAATTFSFAQENTTEMANSANKTKFGVNAALHVSAVNDMFADSKGIFGGNAGVFAQIPLQSGSAPSSWYIVPQLEYSMDGDFGKSSTGDQKLTLSYISLPILAKYYFSLGKSASEKDFFVNFGPQFGFLVSDSFTGPINSVNEGVALANIKKFNVGAVLGGGYKFDNNWEIFGRFDYGFTKVFDVVSNKTANYKAGFGVNYIFGSK